MEDKALEVGGESGKCPACGIYQVWSWGSFFSRYGHNWNYIDGTIEGYRSSGVECYQYSYCVNCSTPILGVKYIEDDTQQEISEILYPLQKLYVENIEELKEYPKVYKLFEEASLCAPRSPRAGLALSRMALESFVKDVIEKQEKTVQEKLKENIKILEELKLIDSDEVSILNDLRIIGNKAVHNVALIDTDEDIELQDVQLVWDFISGVITSMKKRDKLRILKEKASKKRHNQVS